MRGVGSDPSYVPGQGGGGGGGGGGSWDVGDWFATSMGGTSLTLNGASKIGSSIFSGLSETLQSLTEEQPSHAIPPPRSTSGGAAGGGTGGAVTSDPLSVERHEGESESAYVARQRKNQDDAAARLKAKFGSGGMGGGGQMRGVGSDPSYVPGQGGGGGGGGGGGSGFLGEEDPVAAIASGFSSLWGSMASAAADAIKTIETIDAPDEEYYKFPRGSYGSGEVPKNKVAPPPGSKGSGTGDDFFSAFDSK